MEKTPLDRIIEIAGGVPNLVREINSNSRRTLSHSTVSRQAIDSWAMRGIPPGRAILLEEIVKGTVTRYEMCPAVFGKAPDEQPTEAAP